MKPDILYEDDALLVIHKPAGLAVETAKIGEKDCVSGLKNYLAGHGRKPYLGVIHRLDQPVEGIVVFAKTPEAAKNLSGQLQKGQMEKYYVALLRKRSSDVEKEAEVLPLQQEKAAKTKAEQTAAPEKRLTDFLWKDPKSNLSRVVKEGTKGAKKAELTYQILEEDEKFLLCEIHLLTGRHHQIRVQMAHAGLPLAGDRKYGGGDTGPYPNICLCAWKLSFNHPATGKKMHFQVTPTFIPQAFRMPEDCRGTSPACRQPGNLSSHQAGVCLDNPAGASIQ